MFAACPVALPRQPHDPAWVSPFEQDLIVLVGVTGAGKSTLLKALEASVRTFRLLPERRELTDALIIGPMEPGDTLDRAERFRRTAAFQQSHPGGMAEALSGTRVEPDPQPVVFDGLRGEHEVRFAAGFPRVRFVELTAPDEERVRRLLGRADRFDGLPSAGGDLDPASARSRLAEVEGATEVFTPAQLDRLAALTASGFPAAEIAAKAAIVVAERRNYDPAAASAVLAALPPERVLRLDTGVLGAAEVGKAALEWL
ncbi:MAG TPA: AAA family ATPase [Deinococcales bacterium]|nr:AAA family ATPase [Deinococcales bacterium]